MSATYSTPSLPLLDKNNFSDHGQKNLTLRRGSFIFIIKILIDGHKGQDEDGNLQTRRKHDGNQEAFRDLSGIGNGSRNM